MVLSICIVWRQGYETAWKRNSRNPLVSENAGEGDIPEFAFLVSHDPNYPNLVNDIFMMEKDSFYPEYKC